MPDWSTRARRIDEDPDLFFPPSEGTRARKQIDQASAICVECALRSKCLAFALYNNIEFGIWAGATQKERARLRRAAEVRKNRRTLVRYRGIKNGHRVLFLNPWGIEQQGVADGDIVGEWHGDDRERRVPGFRFVQYKTRRQTAAAYYPETNPLVPIASTAEGSNTPTSKSFIVRLVPTPERSS
jgi:hypothetical protein